jgi:hypothetical protein
MGSREVIEVGGVFGAWLNSYRRRRSVEHDERFCCGWCN